MQTNNKCTVYIDEAGDLGIGRGTQWFVITGVIVKEEDEKTIRAALKAIRNKFNLNEIHIRKIRDFYKISYISSQLKDLPFTTVSILMDTNISELKDSIKTYNYMCRFLLERVSWYLRDNGLMGKIVLSSRGTIRDGELIEYINTKLIPYEDNEICNVFTNVESKSAREWDLLQLADVCATSMFKSHEINSLGFTTPCHMSLLKNRVYSRNGSIDKYGIKYYSENMRPKNSYFSNHKLCNKK
jgi:hypothetical protein